MLAGAGREGLLHGGRDEAHVGLAGEALLGRRHEPAHVGRADRAAERGADVGRQRGNLGGDLRDAETLRQIALEHPEFGRFLGDEVGPAAGLELRDRVLALLDQPIDDRDHRGIVEHDALVDLALLDGGEQAADREQAVGVARAHREFHVVGDAILQGHVRARWEAVVPESRKPARLRTAGFAGDVKASVHALGQLHAADALEVALHRGRLLALALGSGLLVELARTQIGEQAELLDRALEAAQGHVERFVFLDANGSH